MADPEETSFLCDNADFAALQNQLGASDEESDSNRRRRYKEAVQGFDTRSEMQSKGLSPRA